MKCTKCGIREAKMEIHVRNNNHVEKMYLCADCAKDYKPEVNLESFDMLNKLINGSPMGLLSNLNNIHIPRTLPSFYRSTNGSRESGQQLQMSGAKSESLPMA